MATKIVSLRQLSLRSEVDAYYVPNDFRIVPHITFALKITILQQPEVICFFRLFHLLYFYNVAQEYETETTKHTCVHIYSLSQCFLGGVFLFMIIIHCSKVLIGRN